MTKLGFEVVGGAFIADPEKEESRIVLPPKQAGRKDGMKDTDQVIVISTLPILASTQKALVATRKSGETEMDVDMGRGDDR